MPEGEEDDDVVSYTGRSSVVPEEKLCRTKKTLGQEIRSLLLREIILAYYNFLNLAKIYFAQAPVENATPAKSLISKFYIWRRRLLEITRLRNIEFRIFIFGLVVNK